MDMVPLRDAAALRVMEAQLVEEGVMRGDLELDTETVMLRDFGGDAVHAVDTLGVFEAEVDPVGVREKAAEREGCTLVLTEKLARARPVTAGDGEAEVEGRGEGVVEGERAMLRLSAAETVTLEDAAMVREARGEEEVEVEKEAVRVLPLDLLGVAL